MLPQAAVLLLSALSVAASPVRRCSGPPSGEPRPPNTGSPGGPAPVVVPTLPVNGGARELAGPGSLALKHLVLGHGIQNYTCSAAGEKATAVGALAVLWDVEPLFPGVGPRSLSPEAWSSLTSNVLYNTDIPLNLQNDPEHPYAADLSAPFPANADLTLPGIDGPLSFVGHHFFGGSVPIFDLSGLPDSPIFVSKKNDGIPAPQSADRGITKSGAVDWLQLGDSGSSRGVTLGYRVMTAGGVAATCTEAGETQSVPYTAQYWLYA